MDVRPNRTGYRIGSLRRLLYTSPALVRWPGGTNVASVRRASVCNETSLGMRASRFRVPRFRPRPADDARRGDKLDRVTSTYRCSLLRPQSWQSKSPFTMSEGAEHLASLEDANAARLPLQWRDNCSA